MLTKSILLGALSLTGAFAATSCPATGSPQAAATSVSSAVAALITAVTNTDNAVVAFQQSQGINGALSIQSTESVIETNAKALQSALQTLGTASAADYAFLADALQQSTTIIAKLLGDLVAKEAALVAVGTGQIVVGDLNSLQGITYDIVSLLYKNVPCQYADDVVSAFAPVITGYSSAFSAYSATGTPAPATPTACANCGGSAPASSAAESSAPASSAAESSAPASSAAESSAPASSAPASSAPASSAAESSAPASSAPASSAPASSAAESSAPASSAPVSSAPVSSEPASSAPGSSAAGSCVVTGSPQAAATSVSSAVAALISAVTDTDNAVVAFQQSQGINGALAIQSTESVIETDAKALQSALQALGAATPADYEFLAAALQQSTTVIAKLLNDLVAKASALVAVGTGQIVVGDLNSLEGITFDIITLLYKNVPCQYAGEVISAFAPVITGYSSAFSAYSATGSAAPATPTTCANTCGGGGESSAPASSSTTSSPVPASSAAISSAPASSAPASSASTLGPPPSGSSTLGQPSSVAISSSPASSNVLSYSCPAVVTITVTASSAPASSAPASSAPESSAPASSAPESSAPASSAPASSAPASSTPVSSAPESSAPASSAPASSAPASSAPESSAPASSAPASSAPASSAPASSAPGSSAPGSSAAGSCVVTGSPQAAATSVSSAVAALISAVTDTDNAVVAFQQSQGINGALAIQSTESVIETDAKALQSALQALGAATPADYEFLAAALQQSTTVIAKLLNDLVAKASALVAVGTGQIVVGDLNSLEGITFDIITLLYKNVPCQYAGEVISAFAPVITGYSSAFSAYSATGSAAPATPTTCANTCGGGGASSAPASSAPASSAPASSAPASSAPASSAPASSAPASSAPESSAPASSAPASSAPASSAPASSAPASSAPASSAPASSAPASSAPGSSAAGSCVVTGSPQAAATSVSSAVAALISAVTDTDNAVVAFQQSQGINGALAIQSTESVIETDAKALQSALQALGAATPADYEFLAAALQQSTTVIAKLLNDLVAKASALVAVGTGQIVVGDLNSLEGITFDIITLLYKNVPCQYAGEVISAFAPVITGYSSAFSAYSATGSAAPATPTTCANTCGGGGASSAPASSAPASSAPASSAPASSAPGSSAPASSAPASSAPASSAPASSAPASSAPASSAPASSAPGSSAAGSCVVTGSPQAAATSVSSAVAALISAVTDTDNAVVAFQQSQGINGALAIQSTESVIETDAKALQSALQALGAATPADYEFLAAALQQSTTVIAKLLNDLVAKASALVAVGTGQIVVGDLNSLEGITFDIITLLYKNVPCQYAGEVISAFAPVITGYSSAFSAYSATGSAAPATPTTCANTCGGGGASSAPASSAPASSAPASSAPGSSAPVSSAPESSAPASSAPGSSAPASSAPASSAPASSAPASSAPGSSAAGSCVVTGSPQAAATSVSSAVAALISAVTDTDNAVVAFQQSQGINGALAIQSTESVIETDAKALQSALQALGAATPADYEFLAAALQQSTTVIAKLLNDLVAKASALVAVGTGQIVVGDLNSLEGITFDIITLLYKNVPCQYAGEVISAFAPVITGYSSAFSAYSATGSAAPATPTTCANTCGGGGASSAPASSAPASSAPASSAPASSAPGSSAPASSAPASSAPASSAPASSAPASSAPVSSAPGSSAAGSCVVTGSPQAAATSVSSAVAALISAVTNTDNAVVAFQQSQGINGALSIQSTESVIETDAKALQSALQALGAATPADYEFLAAALQQSTTVIAKLLNDLVAKASALVAVGTGQIVVGDLNSLEGITYDIITLLYKNVPCQYAGEVISAFAPVITGYSSAFSAYSATGSAAPATPTTCANTCGGGGASSAPASSVGGSSAPTSVPSSSSGFASSQGGPSSKAPSSSLATTVPVTTTSKPSSASTCPPPLCTGWWGGWWGERLISQLECQAVCDVAAFNIKVQSWLKIGSCKCVEVNYQLLSQCLNCAHFYPKCDTHLDDFFSKAVKSCGINTSTMACPKTKGGTWKWEWINARDATASVSTTAAATGSATATATANASGSAVSSGASGSVAASATGSASRSAGISSTAASTTSSGAGSKVQAGAAFAMLASFIAVLV